MKNLLVERGTAWEALGAASMTKAKPLTVLYQFQFWAGSLCKADKKTVNAHH
jgi:hypothetical protein